MLSDKDALERAIAQKFAQLLVDDEAGWENTIQWINTLALDNGVELFLEFKSSKHASDSLMCGLRNYTDFAQRFPNGKAELDNFEVAEELFWRLMPF